LWWLLFVVGLLVSFAMVFRSQVEDDQLEMLYHGWMFAVGGEWLQHGLNTSAGGNSPGGLLSLLVGLPLVVWHDYRAPAMMLWLLSLAGYLMLDRIVGRSIGSSGRVVFAVLYWLSPWRMYFTSSLWNPNYMFFLGALHLWAAFQIRRQPRFWASFLCVLIVGMGVQIHTSAMVLAFVTVLLWWCRTIRVDWWGVAAGVLVVLASLVPWMLDVIERPELIPGGTGFPFRNLIVVYPVLRGLLYLLRYPSLAVPGQVLDLDFAPDTTGDDALSSMIAAGLTVLGGLTVVLSCASYRRFLRGSRRMWRRPTRPMTDRVWLYRYLYWSLAGTLLAFAFSPTTTMFWQGFPIFHAAVLVTVLFVITVERSRRRRLVHRLLTTYAALSLATLCVIGFAGPLFRLPGPPPPPGPPPDRDDYWNRMHYDHPMFHDYELLDRCRVIIDPEYGGWPDSFPDPEKPQGRR
jgi:hypothetical protein